MYRVEVVRSWVKHRALTLAIVLLAWSLADGLIDGPVTAAAGPGPGAAADAVERCLSGWAHPRTGDCINAGQVCHVALGARLDQTASCTFRSASDAPFIALDLSGSGLVIVRAGIHGAEELLEWTYALPIQAELPLPASETQGRSVVVEIEFQRALGEGAVLAWG